jgi:RNA polymerase sigma-70 factor (ECF subfamily)
MDLSPAGLVDLDSWLEQVLDQYWVRVKGLLLRLVGDPDQAEDLALEVFLRLYRQVQNDPSIDNLPGWLYRVGMHQGLNALRTTRRRNQYERSAGM